MNEVANGTADRFEMIDTKLAGLSKLLEQIRLGNEQAQRRARARERDDDAAVGEVLPVITKLN